MSNVEDDLFNEELLEEVEQSQDPRRHSARPHGVRHPTPQDGDELLDGVKELLRGQRRMERYLRKLAHVSASGANVPELPPLDLEGTRGAGGAVDPPLSPTSPKSREPAQAGEFAAAPTRASSAGAVEILASMGGSAHSSPAWFLALQVSPELDGSIEQLAQEFEIFQSWRRRNLSDPEASVSSGGLAWDLSLNTGSSVGGRPSTRTHIPRRWLPMLSPSSRIRATMDLLSLVVLTYELSSIPFFMAFDLTQTGVLLWISNLSAAFWVIDMCLHFRTGIYVDGDLEMRPQKVTRAYLRSGFPLDASLVTLDLVTIVVNALSQSKSAAFAKFVRTSKGWRIVRLATALRMRRMQTMLTRKFWLWINDMSEEYAYHAAIVRFMLSTTKFLLLLLWLNHLVACLWCWVGREGLFFLPSDTGHVWLDLSTGGLDGVYSDFDILYQYSTALHWAITQMTPGSMQVFPVNSSERFFNIVCLLFGLLVFSTLISSISACVVQFTVQVKSHMEMMAKLGEFLSRFDMPADLRIRVSKQADMKLKQRPPLVLKDVKHLVDKLSLSLRNELQLELCNRPLMEHPYFNFLSEAHHSAWAEVCRTCVEFSMLMRKDTLFLSGALATGMHFIMDGCLSYALDKKFCSEEMAVPVEVERGRWSCEAALWCDWRHMGLAEVHKASTRCEVLSLGAQELLRVLTRHALVRHLSWAYAESFHKFLMHSVPPLFECPNDFAKPFEPDEVIAAMPREATVILGQVALEVLTKPSKSVLGWLRGVSQDNMHALMEEVNAGGSALLVRSKNRQKEVVRCVPLVVVRLARSDGRVLVRLRLIKGADGELQASCKLPGGKQRSGEHPDACYRRLLQDDLMPLAPGLQATHVGVDAQQDHSRRLGVPTRYVRTVIEARWLDEADESLEALRMPDVINPRAHAPSRVMRGSASNASTHLGTPMSAGSSISLAIRRSGSSAVSTPSSFNSIIYRFPDGEKYAWVTDEEFDFYCSKKGQPVLFEWLEVMSTEEELENERKSTRNSESLPSYSS